MAYSNAEKEFRKRFPFANVQTENAGAGLTRYTVFAGDYVCESALTQREAFQKSLKFVQEGLLQPDPNEVATEFRA